MARPAIPETDKKRTVPFRMTKPDYRQLAMLMKLTDTSIQEHLRVAMRDYLATQIDEIAPKVSFKLPSSYELGSWSDSQFGTFMDSIGKRHVDNPVPDHLRSKDGETAKASPRLKIGGKFRKAA